MIKVGANPRVHISMWTVTEEEETAYRCAYTRFYKSDFGLWVHMHLCVS